MGHDTPRDHGENIAGCALGHHAVVDEHRLVGAGGDRLILGQNIWQQSD